MTPRAYEQCLLAWSCFRESKFPSAIAHATRSIDADTNNAMAHLLIAETYLAWSRYYNQYSDTG